MPCCRPLDPKCTAKRQARGRLCVGRNRLEILRRQWESLNLLLEHSDAELSNSRLENHVRPFAIGRKKWLFADTTKGADASAIIYSVVCSAEANGIDVHSYLTFPLTELPKLYAKDPRSPVFSPFLPWNFKP